MFTHHFSVGREKVKLFPVTTLTFGKVRVDLERPDAGVLGLPAGVDALLLVHRHHLVAGEQEGVVVPEGRNKKCG